MKIKLCGIRREEEILEINRLKPDYIGFVFFTGSRRWVSPERAAELRTLLAPEIRAVGVFVNELPETVAEYLERGIIDMAQLHGQEDAAYVRNLRDLTDRPLMQAFRIAGPSDLARAEESEADMILLDSGTGSGKTFDWKLLKDMRRPYFLAGGLDPENVAEAVGKLRPYGVDVSSGIETEKRKDPGKMRAFVENARNA